MSGPMETAREARYRKAADGLEARMKIWKRLAQQAKECGRSEIRLKVAEFWETEDELALAEFEAAKAELVGAVPLPFEVAG